MKKQMAIWLAALGFGLFTCKDKPLEPERINPLDPAYVGPKPMQLIAPKDNDNIDTRALEFQWKDTSDAERYQFQAGTTKNFDAQPNTIRIDTTVAQNSLKAPRRFDPPALKEIFWRVRGRKVRSGATLIGDWSQPFKVNLTKPQIEVTVPAPPAPIDFGVICVTKPPSNKTTTIRNMGIGELKIDTIKIAQEMGDMSLAFKITNVSNSGPLAAGATRNISVDFTPSSGGGKNAALQIFCNDVDNKEFKIALRGTGNKPELQTISEPPPGPDGVVDFGSAKVNDPTDEKSAKFTLTNTGSAEFKIKISLGGTNPSHFRFEETTFSLSPTMPTKTVTVVFAPTNYGEKKARLQIEGDCSFVREVKLKGTGI